MEKCEVFDRVESCKEFVRRNVRVELGVLRRKLRVVRSLLERFRGIIDELRTVRSLLVEMARY